MQILQFQVTGMLRMWFLANYVRVTCQTLARLPKREKKEGKKSFFLIIFMLRHEVD
jgi:hypothetical protein